MRRFALILAALSLAGPAAGQEAPNPSSSDSLQDCSAHRFETFVERLVDGEPRKSRVRLCGKQGQSETEWIGTLEDAIAKLRADQEISAEARTQIIAAITGEIARLRDPSSASAAAAPVLTPRAAPRPRDIRDDYASLPPMPPPTAAKPIVAPTATSKNLPAGASGQPVVARSVAVETPLIASSLDFDCYVAGDLTGPAPCIEFQRDTLITVRARSEVPAGIELHFARNGSDRAQVAIGPMKAGRTKRIPLPAAVCRGVGDGRLTIAVSNGSRQSGTEGPFPLRCG